MGWKIAAVVATPVAWNGLLYLRLRRVRSTSATDRREQVAGRRPFPLAFAAECTALEAYLGLALVGWCLPRRYGDDCSSPRVLLLPAHAAFIGAYTYLARRLARRGFRVVVAPLRSMRRRPAEAAAALQRIFDDQQAEEIGPVHLVAHGWSGLVARLYLRRHPPAGRTRLITLGSPHRGTRLWGRVVSKADPRSPFLRDLGAADPVPDAFDVTSLYSAFDATVLPPENGYYPGAFNILVQNVGHAGLVFSRLVLDLLAENLAAPAKPA